MQFVLIEMILVFENVKPNGKVFRRKHCRSQPQKHSLTSGEPPDRRTCLCVWTESPHTSQGADGASRGTAGQEAAGASQGAVRTIFVL